LRPQLFFFFCQCGKSAFARISKAWTPTNQSIPHNVARRLVTRDGETPVVRALSIDMNFGASDLQYVFVLFFA